MIHPQLTDIAEHLGIGADQAGVESSRPADHVVQGSGPVGVHGVRHLDFGARRRGADQVPGRARRIPDVELASVLSREHVGPVAIPSFTLSAASTMPSLSVS